MSLLYIVLIKLWSVSYNHIFSWTFFYEWMLDFLKTPLFLLIDDHVVSILECLLNEC